MERMGANPLENGDINQQRWNDPMRDDPRAARRGGAEEHLVDGVAPEPVPADPVAETGQRMRGRGGSKDSYTIGEVVERLRPEFPTLSVSKIRYLERRRLINLTRTRGGYRLFSGQDIELLKYILTLQDKEYLPLKVISLRSGTPRSRAWPWRWRSTRSNPATCAASWPPSTARRPSSSRWSTPSSAAATRAAWPRP
jgi:hypothetical protein